MEMSKKLDLEAFIEEFEARNPGQPEFHQAVREAAEDLVPFVNAHPEYREARLLERLTEPDRLIQFRVCWQDDAGKVQINRGYRVQFCNAIGPYKGGIRFDATVNPSVLKFLGFEQTLKNSLTSLPMGGAKGGADFSPRGRSESEIMRFCQAFMTELHHHIGEDLDIPAGDIGVGLREIGFLFGQYKRLVREFKGALTGKPLASGGSHVRSEATGWGCVYFAQRALEHAGEALEGKSCVISGSGNVALYAASKLKELGATVLALSDSGGTVHAPNGLDDEQIEGLMRVKQQERGRISAFADEFGLDYHDGAKPWALPCDLAFPCATQNEVGEKDARALVDNGCALVCEGANMPSTAEAAAVFREAGLLYAPGKAANAGGVAISGLELTQNSMRLRWSRDEVDQRLQEIMGNIHETCVEHGEQQSGVDYRRGANVGGFVKVADALLHAGIV
jgi:glutamate dehydrogenase (NADP+)